MEPAEIALEAALIVVQNGGSTTMADRTFMNILEGCRQTGVSTVWRLDHVAVTSTKDGRTSTVIRPVGAIGSNLLHASDVERLGARAARGDVDPATLAAEVERIKKRPAPYNRWVMMLAAACVGAFISRVIGGDWGSFGIAFVAAGAGQFVRPMLQARKLPGATVTLACSVLSTLLAAVAVRAGLSEVGPITLIASIFYLVPGLPLINGFVDITTHKYLFIGVERTLNAAFQFLVLAIALAFAHSFVL